MTGITRFLLVATVFVSEQNLPLTFFPVRNVHMPELPIKKV